MVREDKECEGGGGTEMIRNAEIRLHEIMHKNHFLLFEDISNLSAAEFRAIRGAGEKVMEICRKEMRKRGLKFKNERENGGSP